MSGNGAMALDSHRSRRAGHTWREKYRLATGVAAQEPSARSAMSSARQLPIAPRHDDFQAELRFLKRFALVVAIGADGKFQQRADK